MRAPPQVIAFVREALVAGASRAEIEATLREAGWSGAEAHAALGEWADARGLPPVPRPRSGTSPRDALLHAVLFLALGFLVANLGAVAFALIDLWFPDGLKDARAAAGSVRWSVAALVVAWPVWAWLTLVLARAEAADPGRRRSVVGRWLTVASLFVASAVVLGDLVAAVAALLGGELTPRFLLKALLVAFLAGGVAAVYGPTLAAEDER